MAMDPIQPCAVLTGDIVDSSRYTGDQRRRLHTALVRVAEDLQAWFGPAVPRPPDFYRGDGWQLLVAPPGLGLRVGLAFRALLKIHTGEEAADSRLAIGVGGVDFLPPEGVSAGDGEAFRISGTLLQAMTRRERMDFGIGETAEPTLARGLRVVVRLVDGFVRTWTMRQAQAVAGALRGFTQQEIAAACWRPAVTQQAVAQHLQRAGWHAIEEGLSYFESVLGASDYKF
jgi:hypothetical protein